MRSIHYAPTDAPAGPPETPNADPYKIDPGATLAAALEEASAQFQTGVMETLGRLDAGTLDEIYTLHNAGTTQTVEFLVADFDDEENDLPPEWTAERAVHHSPIFRGLSKGAQDALILHAEKRSLEAGEMIREKGLYIATDPDGTELGATQNGKFTGIVWKIGQRAHVGEFMMTLGIDPTVDLTVLHEDASFIFVPHTALEDLTEEDQSTILTNTILSARYLHSTNEELVTDQDKAAMKGEEINPPHYGNNIVPETLLNDPTLETVTYEIDKEIKLTPGWENHVLNGQVTVKSEDGKRTLAYAEPGTIIGEITSVSDPDQPSAQTARLFARKEGTQIGSIPLADPTTSQGVIQRRRLALSLYEKIAGVTRDRAALKN